jgi:hypothetical protein
VQGSRIAPSPTPVAAADLLAGPSNVQPRLALVKPGDTLHLAAGSYAGLALSNLNGTASQWIIVTGPDTDPPTAIVQGPSDGCCDVVEITDSSYLAIEDLQIDGNHVPSAFGVREAARWQGRARRARRTSGRCSARASRCLPTGAPRTARERA